MTDVLHTTSLYFTKIGLPSIVLLSLIGNLLNITILGRYKMRKHPCSLYFVALSINNLIYSTTILVISLLGDGYQIRISIRSSLSCKLVTYFGTLLSALSPSFIILALIDRWRSSSNLQRRNVSNTRITKCLIFMVIIFFSLLFLISLVTASVDMSDIVGCRIRGNTVFINAYNIFNFILFSCFAPLLMLIFGSVTIYNVKRHRMTNSNTLRHRRTENQLIRMLLVQVGVHISLNLPVCAVNLLLSFPSIYQPTASFYAIFFICRVVFQFTYATPFLLYILSARSFRREFIQLIRKLSSCHTLH